MSIILIILAVIIKRLSFNEIPWSLAQNSGLKASKDLILRLDNTILVG